MRTWDPNHREHEPDGSETDKPSPRVLSQPEVQCE